MGLDIDDLHDLARETSAELGIPGAQIAVLHQGQVIEGVAGVTNIETGVPVTSDTLFQIGSTTKLFTAALVMQLVDSHEVGLDTPIIEQLPNFKLSDLEATRTVTPRHLMSMSSGLDNGPYTDYGPGDDALSRYVRALNDLSQSFPPGAGFGYSNASTNVSGRLVEHVTRETWEVALSSRLLVPAGLANTATGVEDIIFRRFAVGHRNDGEGDISVIPRWSYPRSMGPAGGTLCSSAGDLTRFAHLFLRKGIGIRGPRILSVSAVDAMQERQVLLPPTLLADWWGLGPYGSDWDGVEVLGHSGTNISGSSYLLWARDRDLAIATTVNLPGLGYPFAKRVFRELFWRLGEIRTPVAPEVPGRVEINTERLVGQYAMTGITMTVCEKDGGLTISSENELKRGESAPPSPLVPLTPSTFLPTHPAIDGRRGWAIAFVGPHDAPATHLINGFFALSRL